MPNERRGLQRIIDIAGLTAPLIIVAIFFIDGEFSVIRFLGFVAAVAWFVNLAWYLRNQQRPSNEKPS